MDEERVVLKYLDGTVIKGYLRDFSEKAEELMLQEPGVHAPLSVRCDLLKAIFFVKSFEGNSVYNEKKTYGIRKPHGHRTFVKFIDGEDLVGFLESELPWDKGFFLTHHTVNNLKGFFLLPADVGSNNIRVFVFVHAVKDLTVVP